MCVTSLLVLALNEIVQARLTVSSLFVHSTMDLITVYMSPIFKPCYKLRLPRMSKIYQ